MEQVQEWQAFKEKEGGQISREAAELYEMAHVGDVGFTNFSSPEINKIKRRALAAKTRGLVFQNPHTAVHGVERGARARRFSDRGESGEPAVRHEFFWKKSPPPSR